MIKVGIIGNPGSGKTTICRYLKEKDSDIGYLSVDKVTTGNEELHAARDEILLAAHNQTKTSDEIAKMQLDFRSKLSKAVAEQLRTLEESGKKIVLIDYSVLYTLPDLWNSVDYKILVTRDDDKRKEGLLKREGEANTETLETFVKATGASTNSIATDFTIKNDGTLNQLYAQASDVHNIIRPPIRHYSYYIIKPDGIRHFREIYSDLEEIFEGMSSVRIFKIDDYAGIMKKLYYKLFEKYSEFPEVFDTFTRGITSLYGNEGILIIMSELHKDDMEYTAFREKVLRTKLAIREKIMDPDVRMATRIPEYSNLQGNVQLDGQPYRISIPKSLSRIHCPEDNLEDTEEELQILIKSGIMCNENMLGIDDIGDVEKFGSIMGYKGEFKEPRPDIAGFEKERIEEALSR